MSFKQRLARLKQKLVESDIDIAVITKLANVRYLSGFTGTCGALIIAPNKSIFITDFRYKEQAEAEVAEYEIEICKSTIDASLSLLPNKFKGKMVGFESRWVSCQQFERWSSSVEVNWTPLNDAVDNLRLIKDQQELAKIESAAKIADKAFLHILEHIKPGILERDVAIELEHFMRLEGAEKCAFDLIVASGPRSAMPHATNGYFEIEQNSFLVIDIGAVYEGYCSDLTRTIFVGKAGAKDREIYNAVLQAQSKALKKVRPGKKVRAIDAAVREELAREGLDIYFGHNTGHGVGLEVHELPVLSGQSEGVLQPGMVFTVEPGVYITGWGGVRIEDLVTLENDNIRLLTGSPKELIEL